MDENMLWGGYFMPLLLEAMGLGNSKAEKAIISVEYGKYGTVELFGPGESTSIYLIPELFGTLALSPLFNLPDGVQKITISTGLDEFTIVECRFVPIKSDLTGLLGVLENQEYAIPALHHP
jgi:hypothetical protein